MEMPQSFQKINNLTGNIRSRTFSSVQDAFSLSKTEQSLVFHFDNFRQQLEIINHDCMDFVFYVKKDTNQIKVLSFLEQNDELTLQLDVIVENNNEENEKQMSEISLG